MIYIEYTHNGTTTIGKVISKNMTFDSVQYEVSNFYKDINFFSKESVLIPHDLTKNVSDNDFLVLASTENNHSIFNNYIKEIKTYFKLEYYDIIVKNLFRNSNFEGLKLLIEKKLFDDDSFNFFCNFTFIESIKFNNLEIANHLLNKNLINIQNSGFWVAKSAYKYENLKLINLLFSYDYVIRDLKNGNISLYTNIKKIKLKEDIKGF